MIQHMGLTRKKAIHSTHGFVANVLRISGQVLHKNLQKIVVKFKVGWMKFSFTKLHVDEEIIHVE